MKLPTHNVDLYWYEVVVMSSFLECFKNETALLRHKCLVRRLGEAGGGGVIDNYRRNLLDNGVGNWFKGCMMVLIRLTHHS